MEWRLSVADQPGVRVTGQLTHPFPVEVSTLVIERHGHVQGMASRDQVSHLLHDRQSIKWGVGLDEPAVILTGEQSVDIATGSAEPVEPWWDAGESIGELRGLEDQEGADHL